MEGPNSHSRIALLPLPKFVELSERSATVFDGRAAAIESGDARVSAAWERLAAKLTPNQPGQLSGAAQVVIREEGGCVGHREGYQLDVSPEQIELIGGSAAGCFHGLATLAQLIDPATGEVPCGRIVDRPDFATRGLLHDISRGKCPTLDTLKMLADRLASWKINQLQLYIEHTFVFDFDREICGADEGLTPVEVRELDAYCRERFIDLVPAIASLGHMGRVLSMPAYRHLAEIEATKPWEQMTWLERLKGFTLDVLNPQSRELVARMWSDVLDAFSSPVVNICGDEPWDLGRGKNAGRLNDRSRGEAYVDHLVWTHGLCAARGRRTQVWGDVLRNYSHLLSRLPEGMAVLHWGYDDRADYAGTSVFTRSAETHVCPGTSGWKRIINAMDLAERNILTFARTGLAAGAAGLINTDWGDYGHFNALACSWHGIALGASAAWNVGEPGRPQFDRRLATTALGVPHETLASLRTASAIAEKCDTWRLLAMKPQELRNERSLPTVEWCEVAAHSAAAAAEALRDYVDADHAMRRDCVELELGCRFTESFCRRIIAHQTGGQIEPIDDDFAARFSEVWLARNKPLRLRDIVDRLNGTHSASAELHPA